MLPLICKYSISFSIEKSMINADKQIKNLAEHANTIYTVQKAWSLLKEVTECPAKIEKFLFRIRGQCKSE